MNRDRRDFVSTLLGLGAASCLPAAAVALAPDHTAEVTIRYTDNGSSSTGQATTTTMTHDEHAFYRETLADQRARHAWHPNE